MPEVSAFYEKLVTKLVYQHCHSNAKERRVKIVRLMMNGLDRDDAEEIIDSAAEDLDFVHATDDLIWFEQNEDLILFLKNETDHSLGIIGTQLSHITPPSLRNKYNIPESGH